MKLLEPLIFFYVGVVKIDAWNEFIDYRVLDINEPCSDIDVTFDFQRAFFNFGLELVQNLALSHNNYHSTVSPLSAWLSLAALAEGSEGKTKKELLLVLGLPQDRCLRQKYYQIALDSEKPNNDITLARTRLFALDDNAKVNQNWADTASKLLSGISLPLKRNSEASVHVMRQMLGARISTINLRGNSVLLDSFFSQIVWNEAFPNIIQNFPFYNDAGEQVGAVDMMTAKKRVRMTYHPREQMKVIELPVGFDKRYSILISMCVPSTENTIKSLKNSVIFDIFDQLRPTKYPIEVALPRFAMTTEIDLRNILEDMGVNRLWNDPSGTRNISDPAALPSGLFQRSTIVLDNAGINPYKEDDQDIGLSDHETFNDSVYGRDFIVNKTFGLALVDTKSYSVLFATIFSRPTNSFLHK